MFGKALLNQLFVSIVRRSVISCIWLSDCFAFGQHSVCLCYGWLFWTPFAAVNEAGRYFSAVLISRLTAGELCFASAGTVLLRSGRSQQNHINN